VEATQGSDRQAERRESTRRKILDAAVRVFAEKGYHEAAVDDIVRASSTSKGAVYFHFPNKQGVFLALVEYLSGQVIDRMELAIDAEKGRDQSRRFSPAHGSPVLRFPSEPGQDTGGGGAGSGQQLPSPIAVAQGPLHGAHQETPGPGSGRWLHPDPGHGVGCPSLAGGAQRAGGTGGCTPRARNR